MTEVAQEAPITAVEVETEAPTAAKAPVEEVLPPVGAKRALKAVQGQVKDAEEVTRIAITDSENLVAVKMENEFFKVTSQIAQLSKQAEQIQKNYPEYIKSLATKYEVDVKMFTFQPMEGAFVKNPK